jgi:UMF1 family MFS transporter
MGETINQPVISTEATRIQKISWVLYDWANSGYGLVVIGPVFPAFFISVLLPELGDAEGNNGLRIMGWELRGSALIALLTSISMALMAIGAPVLGAVADIKGWTKRLLMLFGVTGSLVTMGMIFLQPGDWLLGAALYVLSNFCFGSSFAFYNAFLPKLTSPARQGSLSGWGFALGYIGGAIALIIALVMIKSAPDNPRMVAMALGMSGGWWLLFGLPAFIFLPEFPPLARENDRGNVLLAGFRRIKHTFYNIRQYRMLFIFLLAFLLYNDGIETVIAMSGGFGTDYLKMKPDRLIIMFLIVQFVAFGGAIVCGYLTDKFGNKPIIVGNLVVWIVASILAMMLTPEPMFSIGEFQFDGTAQFTALGVLIGLVLGGVQAASRSLMALLAPEEIRNEAFGFFSISGKFASIFGPLLYFAFATQWGPRWGVLSVPPFLIAGLIVLLNVREPRDGTATK